MMRSSVRYALAVTFMVVAFSTLFVSALADDEEVDAIKAHKAKVVMGLTRSGMKCGACRGVVEDISENFDKLQKEHANDKTGKEAFGAKYASRFQVELGKYVEKMCGDIKGKDYKAWLALTKQGAYEIGAIAFAHETDSNVTKDVAAQMVRVMYGIDMYTKDVVDFWQPDESRESEAVDSPKFSLTSRTNVGLTVLEVCKSVVESEELEDRLATARSEGAFSAELQHDTCTALKVCEAPKRWDKKKFNPAKKFKKAADIMKWVKGNPDDVTYQMNRILDDSVAKKEAEKKKRNFEAKKLEIERKKKQKEKEERKKKKKDGGKDEKQSNPFGSAFGEQIEQMMKQQQGGAAAGQPDAAAPPADELLKEGKKASKKSKESANKASKKGKKEL